MENHYFGGFETKIRKNINNKVLSDQYIENL